MAIDIDTKLFPEAWKILPGNNERFPQALVVDYELDPVIVEFQGGLTVKFQTEAYGNLVFSTQGLMRIIEMAQSVEGNNCQID